MTHADAIAEPSPRCRSTGRIARSAAKAEPSGTRHVEIGNDGERGGLGLLGTQLRRRPDGLDEPGPELDAGVGHPAADEVGVRGR